MGVTSQQGFKFKLVAFKYDQITDTYEEVILDLFKDEEILLSDNVTGLFDLGILPTDFTRQLTLPGTKKNNHFFEFVYDISVEDPYTFSTNQKVDCYLDFDGIYLSDGYLQLNKVNVYQNKFIDSYEVSLYGGLASFGRDLKTYTLNDLPGLSVYNHTASLQAITSSWYGNLFSGSIVYPMAEYGQRLEYTPQNANNGIDSVEGALCVQDYKPAIRVKKVWDEIFDYFGYTYTSSFMNESWWDDVYMLCNYAYKYPVFSTSSYGLTNFDIETFGLYKIAPTVSSSTQLYSGADYELPWYNILRNPSNTILNNLEFSYPLDTNLRGEINLNFEIGPSGSYISGSGYGVPQFNLMIQGFITNAWVDVMEIPLTQINNYMEDINTYNGGDTKTQKFELLQTFTTSNLQNLTVFGWGIPANTQLRWAIRINSLQFGVNNFYVILDPDEPKSYLQINKVNQLGDGLVMDIPSNMPYGTSGILLIDFISSIQKKYNLVIYPNRTKLYEFIVEPFSNWYKEGQIKDFNKYINLNDKISVTPANNLAVQNLNFGDTLDTDYVSQQFAKAANREFGKQYYVDTENFFSQGTFEVKTRLASTPIIAIPGSGLTDSNAYVGTWLASDGVILSGSACAELNYPNTFYKDITVLNNYLISQGDYLFSDYTLATAFNGNNYFYKYYSIFNSTTYVAQIGYNGEVLTVPFAC